MPDTPMDEAAQNATDTWNFLDCERVLGEYVETYIEPMRKANRESWNNLKFSLED